tara:strand:- start:2542 stop:2736 length:195 start_codon:yes stop_codon:yes gene_type:complete
MIPSDLKIKQTGGFNCTVTDLNKAITGFEKGGHTVILRELQSGKGDHVLGIMYICEPKEDKECI